MMNLFLTILVAVASSFGTYSLIDHSQPQVSEAPQSVVTIEDKTLGGTTPIAGTTYNLAGSGVSQSATSITLQSLTIPQNGYKIQDSDMGDIFYLTLEPGNTTKQEITSCTTVTQNANNTATLSGCIRGLAPITPFTASTTLQFTHGGGSRVIFSDPPQLFNLYTAKANNEYVAGHWTFSSTTVPQYDQVPANQAVGSYASTTAEFASVAYVNAVSFAGVSNGSSITKGIWQGATLGQMKAGTTAGSTGANLTLMNSNATSSNDVATNHIPITQNDGTLKSNFIDQTAAYSWSGASTHSGQETFTATSTFATTTMASSTITNLNVTTSFFSGSNLAKATTTVFTTSGTWVKPAGVTRVKVRVVGGGGGGGGSSNGGTGYGGGGGAGGYAEAWVAVSGNVTVTVGTGGAGGVNNAVGGTGNTSSFAGGVTVSAAGGVGGDQGNSSSGTGGAGGNTTNALVGISGSFGWNGQTPTPSYSGMGGPSIFGDGGRPVTGASSTGNTTNAYGAGGSGASSSGGGQATGGAGKAGIVIVEWVENN